MSNIKIFVILCIIWFFLLWVSILLLNFCENMNIVHYKEKKKKKPTTTTTTKNKTKQNITQPIYKYIYTSWVHIIRPSKATT